MSHDYTQGSTPGDSIPPENIEDMEIGGGDYAYQTDSQQVAEDNVSGTLEPGNYLLKLVRFGGKVETKEYNVFLNGQKARYISKSLSVMLADSEGTGVIFQNLVLPPDDPAQMNAYCHGKKKADDKGNGGFFANQFVNFLGALIPNSIVKGEPMAPIARKLSNWKDQLVWAQVEMDKGGYVKEGIDQATGKAFAPTEPRPQVKLFSFRPHVAGEPCPFKTNPADKAAKPSSKPAEKPSLVGAGVSTNGYRPAPAIDNGVDDV